VRGAITNAVNFPSITAEEAPKLKPFVALAENLGSFAGQLTESGIKRVQISYEGVVAQMNTRALSSAAIAGLLRPMLQDINVVSAPTVARPRPSAPQVAWQRDELAMFLHFGVNTFTDREWGDGREEPAIFAPNELDARQWARTAREAGFRVLILTAKHHDGFCLWPTKTTTHSVASSPWRGGQGDVVREVVDACRVEGLGTGLYLSPWDRHEPSYGDSARYNDLYCAQLTELLTNYGPLRELWFDGANGEGPNGRHQVYDWARIWGLVRRHQPEAVMFSDAGPDVRWIGNERGLAADTNWSTVDPKVVPYPGASGDAVMDMLQHGDPEGSVWRPGETDVSIRPGWFYHPGEDAKVKTPQKLLDIYYKSVGRGACLNLNIPLRNRAAQSDYVTSVLELRQNQLSLQKNTNQVLVDVQNAVIGIQQARARYEAAVKSRELQEQTLAADQRRYSLGAATAFQVIQDQRDLATTQSGEVQAMANYTHARIAFDQALGRTLEVNHVSIGEALKGQISRPSSLPPDLPQSDAPKGGGQ